MQWLDVSLGYMYIKEIFMSTFFIYCPNEPRGSTQSEFELNIEKNMTEIFLITIQLLTIEASDMM